MSDVAARGRAADHLESEVMRNRAANGARGARRNGDYAGNKSSVDGFGLSSVEASGAVAGPAEAGLASARPSPIGGLMPTLRDAVFRRLLAIADLSAAAAGLGLIGLLTDRGVAAVSLASLPLIVVMAKLGGRYDYDEVVLRKSTLEEIPALLVLAASYALVWSLVAFVGGVHMELGGAGVVALWASTAMFLILGRASARALAQVSAPPERALIIGSPQARTMLAHSLGCDPGAQVDVVGFLALEDQRAADGGGNGTARASTLADLDSLVRDLDVERVFLIPTSADSELLLEAVTRTTAIGVKLSIVPRLFEVVGSAVEFDSVGGVTVLGVRRPGLGRSSCAVKRTVDVVGASIVLLASAPLALLVALAIELDSTGPVFFRQKRVGRDGRRFDMLKFRSMYDGAEAQRAALSSLNESDGIFKLSADPRVTRVGRWLRRTSLDELPQLINVLRGEMSLVGPRPLIADEDVLIEGPHRERLQLSPGMTGPWQVLGPQRPPLAEMVKADYLYAANWSLWNDIKIMLRTLAHVIAQRGI